MDKQNKFLITALCLKYKKKKTKIIIIILLLVMLHCWKYVFIISIAVAFFHNVVEEVIAMHFGFVFLVIDTKLNQAYFLQGIN